MGNFFSGVYLLWLRPIILLPRLETTTLRDTSMVLISLKSFNWETKEISYRLLLQPLIVWLERPLIILMGRWHTFLNYDTRIYSTFYRIQYLLTFFQPFIKELLW